MDEDVYRVVTEMEADDAAVWKPFTEAVVRLRVHGHVNGQFDPRGEALKLKPAAAHTVEGDQAGVAQDALNGPHVDVVVVSAHRPM